MIEGYGIGAPPHIYKCIGALPLFLVVTVEYSFSSAKSDCSSFGECQIARTSHLLFDRIVSFTIGDIGKYVFCLRYGFHALYTNAIAGDMPALVSWGIFGRFFIGYSSAIYGCCFVDSWACLIDSDSAD